MTNIGSRIRPFDWCQKQLPWMTLNGRYAFCCRKDASSEPTTKIWMKIDPHNQRQKCRSLTLVCDIRFMRIFAGVFWTGGVKRQWRIENVDFQGFWTLRLRHLRKWGQYYYIVLFSPLSPFQSPQNRWPWMTLTGNLALNSVLRWFGWLRPREFGK